MECQLRSNTNTNTNTTDPTPHFQANQTHDIPSHPAALGLELPPPSLLPHPFIVHPTVPSPRSRHGRHDVPGLSALASTGGSCRKSPHNTRWIPPNGASFPRTTRATYSNFCGRGNGTDRCQVRSVQRCAGCDRPRRTVGASGVRNGNRDRLDNTPELIIENNTWK